jgi:hypothetical protein
MAVFMSVFRSFISRGQLSAVYNEAGPVTAANRRVIILKYCRLQRNISTDLCPPPSSHT